MTNHETLLKFISTQGYKKNSPDKDRPFNLIPSGNITMQDVPHYVYGIDDLGNEMMMAPGEDYEFPGNSVFEIPIKQDGGKAPKYVESKNDPRYKAYQDSLNLYNNYDENKRVITQGNKYYPNPQIKKAAKVNFTEKGKLPNPNNPLTLQKVNKDFSFSKINDKGYSDIKYISNKKIQPIATETYTRKESKYKSEKEYDKAAKTMKSFSDSPGKINWVGYDIQRYKAPQQPILLKNESAPIKYELQTPLQTLNTTQNNTQQITASLMDLRPEARHAKYFNITDKVNMPLGGSESSYKYYPENREPLQELAPEPYNSRTVTPVFQTGGDTGRQHRGVELMMKDYMLQKKEEEELQTRGTIRNPRSNKYKKGVPTAKVSTYTPQSTVSKVWEVATHPVTAFGYGARNEDLPDNFSRGEINPHEQAVDLINPAFYANQVGQFAKNVVTGHPIDAGMNALNVLPLASEYKALSRIGKGLQEGSIIEDVFNPKNIKKFKPYKVKTDLETGVSYYDDYVKPIPKDFSSNDPIAKLKINHNRLNFDDLDEVIEKHRDPFIKQFGNDFKEKDLGFYSMLKEVNENRIMNQYDDPEILKMYINDKVKLTAPDRITTSRQITDSFIKSHGLESAKYTPKETLLTDLYVNGYDNHINGRNGFNNYIKDLYQPVREDFEQLILKNKTKRPETFFRESDDFIVDDVWDPKGNKLNPINFSDLQAGYEYEPKSFYSTTLAPGNISFGNMLSKINVPEGQSILNANSTGVRTHYSELENVLPSKLRYRINEVIDNPKEYGKGYTRVFDKSIVNSYKIGGTMKIPLPDWALD